MIDIRDIIDAGGFSLPVEVEIEGDDITIVMNSADMEYAS